MSADAPTNALANWIRVHEVAFMALNDVLIRAGVIERDALSNELRRFIGGADDEQLAGMVHGLAQTLDLHLFNDDRRASLQLVPKD